MDSTINKELLLDILETLSKLRKGFPYTMLLYVLPPDEVMKVLDIFAGTTVTFPTQQEFLECATFAIARQYDDFDKVPKEILNGLTKRRYKELLAAIERN